MESSKYLKIRKVYSKFVYTILKSDKNAHNNLIKAGKKLGFWEGGKKLVFEREEETNVLMDFLLYEKNGKPNRLIDEFKADNNNLAEEENEILNGMLKNYDSLFEIVGIDKSQSILDLLDLQSKKEYKLKDISFSKTAKTERFIYTRLIPIENINMTSGLSFYFHPKNRLKLLTKISGQLANRNSKNKRTLFEKMFKCHKSYGIEVNYEKT